MEQGAVSPDDERVLWEGRPRTRRILGTSDFFLIPFAIAWTSIAIVFWAVVPGFPWVMKVLFGLIAIQLLVGRFFVKWFQKIRTLYVVIELRALVLRSGDIFEQQALEGVTPEITGWTHNRIVTFGDAMSPVLDSISSRRVVDGNSGLYPSRFVTRRGDVSGLPIRFYDLEPEKGEALMELLSGSGRSHVISEVRLAERAEKSAPLQLPIESSGARPAGRRDRVLADVLKRESLNPSTSQRLGGWLEDSAWRSVLIPAVGVAALVGIVLLLMNRPPSFGIPVGLVVGGSIYAIRRARRKVRRGKKDGT